jgi:hypothetical protein
MHRLSIHPPPTQYATGHMIKSESWPEARVLWDADQVSAVSHWEPCPILARLKPSAPFLQYSKGRLKDLTNRPYQLDRRFYVFLQDQDPF